VSLTYDKVKNLVGRTIFIAQVTHFDVTHRSLMRTSDRPFPILPQALWNGLWNIAKFNSCNFLL